MAKIRTHRDLDVYRKAFDASLAIFRLSKTFPKEETYALTDQIRRCSRSVCANIAEAWRKRRYEGAFVSKLSDADAEAGATLVWLDFARACGCLAEEQHAALLSNYDHICAQLVTMIQQSGRWCL